MSVFLIPLTNTPQTFQISLGSIEYVITCKWNDSPDAGWEIDLADALTGNSIIAGIPLVTGINLLDGLEYLGFPGQLFVFTDGNDYSPPTMDNLGVQSNLYFVSA
jgi:hypothetical protein